MKIKSVVIEIAFVDPPCGDVYYIWVDDTLCYLFDGDGDRYSAELFSWKTDKDIAEQIDREEMQPFFGTKQGQMFLANATDAACAFGCFIRKRLSEQVGYPTMSGVSFMFRMPDEGLPWQEMFK